MVTKTTATATGQKKARNERIRRLLIHAGLVAFGVVMLYPLLWMLSSSFKPTEEIFRDPSLIPSTFMPGNYTEGWTALQHPFHHYLLNSAIVVAGAIIGNLLGCSMAAYAFARLEFAVEDRRYRFQVRAAGGSRLVVHFCLASEYCFRLMMSY